VNRVERKDHRREIGGGDGKINPILPDYNTQHNRGTTSGVFYNMPLTALREGGMGKVGKNWEGGGKKQSWCHCLPEAGEHCRKCTKRGGGFGESGQGGEDRGTSGYTLKFKNYDAFWRKGKSDSNPNAGL